MNDVSISTAVWYGDDRLRLDFPDGWDVRVAESSPRPALSTEELRAALLQPVGTPALRDLARGRQRVALLVDDLTRPTPAADILPAVLAELSAAGIASDDILLVVAAGTHAPLTDAEIRKKVGSAVATRYRVVPHDSQRDVEWLGRTRRGTPIWVNAHVLRCDLKIGIGVAYPHLTAGFSGGTKIIAPGVCGIETVRQMHDRRRGADRRGGSLDSEFLDESREIADRVGLDMVINVVIDGRREIVDVHAGHHRRAHEAAAASSRSIHTIDVIPDADVVVANMYPFDTTLQFMVTRGLWPFTESASARSKVAVVACSEGIGTHQLGAVHMPPLVRVARRLSRLRPRDLLRLPAVYRRFRRIRDRRALELDVLSPGLSSDELRAAFPRGRLYRDWSGLRAHLERVHARRGVRVAIYPYAPLQLPRSRDRAVTDRIPADHEARNPVPAAHGQG